MARKNAIYWTVLLAILGGVLEAASWSTPTVVFSDAEQNGLLPSLALHPTTGHATLAWTIQNGDSYSVAASLFNGSSWSAPTTLSGISSRCPQPIVAMDGKGNAIAVWDFFDGEELNIESARCEMNSWSSAAGLAALGPLYDSPSLALTVNDAGYGVVSWKTNTHNIQAKTYLFDAKNWSSAYQLNESSIIPTENVDPRIGLDAQNRLFAIFTTASNVWSTSFLSTNPPESPTDLSLVSLSLETVSPAMKFNPSTGFCLYAFQVNNTYKSLLAGANYAYGQHTDWNYTVIANPRDLATDLRLALNTTNQSAGAAWVLETGEVQAAIFDGVRWFAPTTLSPNGTTPSIANNQANNHVLVAWVDQSEGPSNKVIKVIEFDGKTWGIAQELSSVSSAIGAPTIAIDGSGRGMISWHRLAETHTVVEVSTSSFASDPASHPETRGDSGQISGDA